MHITNNIRAYILAGGKSSRMGDDKGLLDLNGKCLIEHVIDAVKPAISNITIVTGNPVYSKFGFPLVADLLPNAGPAGGIYTALIHTTAMQTFICSCDMPFITTAGLQYLLKQSADADICVPLYHGHPEPLFGLYAADSAERWLAVLQQGTYKLQKYFDAFNTRYVPVDNNLLFDNLFFSNINSPADLEAARKQWR